MLNNSNAPKFSKLKKAKLKSPPKRVRETTIMKWLQNSDLNKNEESFDIFKAICNENDDGESEECGILTEQELRNNEPINISDSFTMNETELFCNFTKKLKSVQKYLKQLEAEIENEMKDETCAKDNVQLKVKSENVDNGSSDEEGADDNTEEGACAGEEFIITSNGKTCKSTDDQVLAIENKKYLLLKTCVDMLREAYNEIWSGMKDQEASRCHKQKEQHGEKEKSSPPNFEIQTQFQTCNESQTTVTSKRLYSQTKITSLESDNAESDSEAESLTLSSPINSTRSPTVVEVKTNAINPQLLEQLKNYQSQVEVLNAKLKQNELDAHHTMEIMQFECDDVKLKMGNLSNTVDALKNEKMALEEAIIKKQNNSPLSSPHRSILTKVCKENDIQWEKELELEEDSVLKSINVTALEREEELITYKERLDEQQRENIDLRNEIVLLKQKSLPGTTKDLLLKQYLPYGFIVVAIIIYFLTTYH